MMVMNSGPVRGTAGPVTVPIPRTPTVDRGRGVVVVGYLKLEK
jgi:hypothetical protein